MRLFKKSIKVWIDSYETFIYVKISINGNQISKICCLSQEDGTLLITDITPYENEKYTCKGYGSMMMEELLKYAYENDIKIITGNLSEVDREHENRLYAFYKKHGFEIIVFDNPSDLYYGQVRKQL